jgi:hypothetical protein
MREDDMQNELHDGPMLALGGLDETGIEFGIKDDATNNANARGRSLAGGILHGSSTSR